MCHRTIFAEQDERRWRNGRKKITKYVETSKCCVVTAAAARVVTDAHHLCVMLKKSCIVCTNMCMSVPRAKLLHFIFYTIVVCLFARLLNMSNCK